MHTDHHPRSPQLVHDPDQVTSVEVRDAPTASFLALMSPQKKQARKHGLVMLSGLPFPLATSRLRTPMAECYAEC